MYTTFVNRHGCIDWQQEAKSPTRTTEQMRINEIWCHLYQPMQTTFVRWMGRNSSSSSGGNGRAVFIFYAL